MTVPTGSRSTRLSESTEQSSPSRPAAKGTGRVLDVRIAQGRAFQAASEIAYLALHSQSVTQFQAGVFSTIDGLVGIDSGAIATITRSGVSALVGFGGHDARAMSIHIDRWIGEINPSEMKRLVRGPLLDNDAFSSQMRRQGGMYREHFIPTNVQSFVTGLCPGSVSAWGYTFCRSGRGEQLRDRDVDLVAQLLPTIAAGEELFAIGCLGAERATDNSVCPLPRLAGRQAEIAQLVARGLQNKEIAALLGISPNTVRNVLAQLFERLSVSTRTELAFVTRDQELSSSSESDQFWSRLRGVLTSGRSSPTHPLSADATLPPQITSWTSNASSSGDLR